MASRLEVPERVRGTLSPWVLLGVLVFFLGGVLLVATRHWRRGSVLIGGSLVLAGFARLVLPQQIAGLLVVRHRAFDVAIMMGAGVTIMALGMAVPGVYTG